MTCLPVLPAHNASHLCVSNTCTVASMILCHEPIHAEQQQLLRPAVHQRHIQGRNLQGHVQRG